MDLIENPELFAIGLIGFIVSIFISINFKFKSENRARELSSEPSRYRLDKEWIEADKLHGSFEIIGLMFFIIGLFGFFG